MRTRLLSGLAITLLAAGLAIGTAGTLRDSAAASRVGVLVVVLAYFPWNAAQTRRAAALTDDQIDHERSIGYLHCLDHVRRGILTPPPATGGPGQTEPESHTPRSYARGHLHAITTTTYTPPERKAQ
jgi:hypothetical protein